MNEFLFQPRSHIKPTSVTKQAQDKWSKKSEREKERKKEKEGKGEERQKQQRKTLRSSLVEKGQRQRGDLEGQVAREVVGGVFAQQGSLPGVEVVEILVVDRDGVKWVGRRELLLLRDEGHSRWQHGHHLGRHLVTSHVTILLLLWLLVLLVLARLCRGKGREVIMGSWDLKENRKSTLTP